MAATVIKVLNSGTSGAPNTLATGEFAYSYLAGTQSNGGDRLYVGTGTETGGIAANIDVVGGKYFTDMLDHVKGVVTVNSALIVDANGKLDILDVDNIRLNGNTISATSGALILSGNASSATVLETARSISLSGDVTGTASFDGSADIIISATIAANSIALGTDTTGNYVGSVATTAPLAGGAVGSEGGLLTLSLATAYGDTQNPYASKTANFILAAPSGAAGVPTFRAVTVADIPTLNQSTTGSAATLTTGRTISLTGDVTGTSGTFNGSGNISFATTIAANSVALGTDTTGNYVATIADAGNTNITVSNSGTETAAVTLDLTNTTVSAGSYGSNTNIPTFTVDAKGRLTAAGSVAISTTLGISDGIGGTDNVALGVDTLVFTGGEGIDIAVTNNTVTISGEDASVTNKGIASFNTADFSVTTGAVSIKAAGVTNTQLVNSSLTIGSTTVSLGGTSTLLSGLTEITVDNIYINGSEISTTGLDQDISLNPNGAGNVAVNGARISGVADPVNPTDAANKSYVDNAVSGLTWKESVNLLSDINVAITGNTLTLVIDGHAALDATDNGLYRVLLTGQTNDAENGIYEYLDNGVTYSLVRGTESDTFGELIGASVFVTEGTVYGSTGWVQSNSYLTDFTAQQWVQFSGSGAYTAGQALELTGTTFDVKVAATGGIIISADELQLNSTIAGAGLTYTNGVVAVVGTTNRITANANNIDIASTYVGQTTITTLGTIATGTWNATIIAAPKGGTGIGSYGTGDILYASSASTLSKLVPGVEGTVLQINASGLPVWGIIDGGTY